MTRILLWIGGGLNLLFVVLHVTMNAWVQSLSGITADDRAIIYILNASIAATLLVFAYLSIFHWKGLASTGVGRGAAICIAAWWLARIVEGVVFTGIAAGAWVLYAICLAVAGLYVAAIFLPSGARQVQTAALR